MKNKKKSKKKLQGVMWIAAVTAALIFLVVFTDGKQTQTDTKQQVSTPNPYKVKWATCPLGPVLTNDLVGETLLDLDRALAALEKEGQADTNLIRLIGEYRTTSVSRDQLDADLKKLKGRNLGFIGQIHLGVDLSEEKYIRDVQADIAVIVHDNFTVLWAEEFGEGKVITTNNFRQIGIADSLESDLPMIRSSVGKASDEQYQRWIAARSASHQFILNPRGVEVRGGDYRPLKIIQQHLLEFKLSEKQREGKPMYLGADTFDKYGLILIAARDVYILRQIALHADWTKRNVLVIGSVHTKHIMELLSKYGAECTPIFPNEKG